MKFCNVCNNILKISTKNDILKFMSCSFVPSSKIIYIFTDSGRLTRPLYNIQNKTIQDEKSLLSLVEYIDTFESECCLVVWNMDTITKYSTHCEIHPSMILGVCASIIPFPDHNQVSL